MSDMGAGSVKSVHKLWMAYWSGQAGGLYQGSPAGPSRGSECTVGRAAVWSRLREGLADGKEGCEMRHAGSSHPVSFRPVGSRSFSRFLPGNFFRPVADLKWPLLSRLGSCGGSRMTGREETFLPPSGICPVSVCHQGHCGAMVSFGDPSSGGPLVLGWAVAELTDFLTGGRCEFVAGKEGVR